MTTLTAVYVAATGHVLAALTHTAQPPAGERVAAVVGKGLPVRLLGGAVGLTVPTDLLAAVTVDDGSGLLDDPRAFRVVEVVRGGETLHELAGLGAAGQVTLTASAVTVTASTVVTAARPVVVVMEQQPGTHFVRKGVIAVGATQVAMPISVPNGTWQVVAFVAGQSPVAGGQTV